MLVAPANTKSTKTNSGAALKSFFQRFWLTGSLVALILGALGVFAWETGRCMRIAPAYAE